MDGVKSEANIIVEQRGNAAIIWLDRPSALNSLTLPMVRALRDTLDECAQDDTLSCVFLAGKGQRGLCAGGDIRALYTSGKAGNDEASVFWREEFALNSLIASYPKPYVTWMDGIVMGGGVGLASHGRHRIVTERTRLAMPETGIGYFPDVGATWLLPGAPGEIGTWLGLTGNEIGGADAIFANLADYHVRSTRLDEVITKLGELAHGCGDDAVEKIIHEFSERPSAGAVSENVAVIDHAFRHDRIEDIILALGQADGDFAAETLAVLKKRSPTSLKLTLRLLRAGKESESLDTCLEREFVAAQEILRGHDFYEGVRAAVIDKDRNPRWLPSALADVSDADIDRYFTHA